MTTPGTGTRPAARPVPRTVAQSNMKGRLVATWIICAALTLLLVSYLIGSGWTLGHIGTIILAVWVGPTTALAAAAVRAWRIRRRL